MDLFYLHKANGRLQDGLSRPKWLVQYLKITIKKASHKLIIELASATEQVLGHRYFTNIFMSGIILLKVWQELHCAENEINDQLRYLTFICTHILGRAFGRRQFGAVNNTTVKTAEQIEK